MPQFPGNTNRPVRLIGVEIPTKAQRSLRGAFKLRTIDTNYLNHVILNLSLAPWLNRPNLIDTTRRSFRSNFTQDHSCKYHMFNAKQFLAELDRLKSPGELNKLQKYFKGDDGDTKALGVKFGDVFKLSQQYWEMPLPEINILLDSNFYEVRMGAVSIMDYKAKNKNTTPELKKQLFDLYLKRHDRLNNWDLVDRGAYNIVGEYLMDKSRDILYKLAKSKDPWQRRSSIVATYAFIKKGQTHDTFKIAEMLIHDQNEYINKAVGGWIREAGKKDEKRLLQFLDKYAGTIPSETLRYAVEKLKAVQKKKYLLKK